MAGEIQLNSTTFATESGGTITIDNVDSATNRQNLGLEIGVDVQAFDADTTKNDVANTFTANQIISVTDNTNAALRVTQLGTGNALVVEDETNPDSTPFVVDASGNVGIGTSSPSSLLTVNGNYQGAGNIITSSGIIRAPDGSASQPSIQPGVDSDTGFYRPDTNTIGFSTGGTERMRINSSGALMYSGGVYAATKRITGLTLTGDGITYDTLFDLWSGNAGRGQYLVSVTRQGASVALRTLAIVASSTSSVSLIYTVIESNAITIGVSGSNVTVTASSSITVNAIAIPLAIDGN